MWLDRPLSAFAEESDILAAKIPRPKVDADELGVESKGDGKETETKVPLPQTLVRIPADVNGITLMEGKE